MPRKGRLVLGSNGERVIVMCCVCKRVRGTTGRFRRRLVLGKLPISHTYCPRCARLARGRIRRLRPTLKLPHYRHVSKLRSQ